jgi:hypothetical protein
MNNMAMPSEDVKMFIGLGLAGLIDEIPVLIQDARLSMGINDVALAIFVDPDAKRYNSYAKPRLALRADLMGQISTEAMTRFDPQPIGEVPIMVSFRDHVFVFDYILQGTSGVLS